MVRSSLGYKIVLGFLEMAREFGWDRETEHWEMEFGLMSIFSFLITRGEIELGNTNLSLDLNVLSIM